MSKINYSSLKSNEIHASNINLGDGFNKFSASAKDELSLDLNSGICNDSVNLKSLYSEVTINDTGGNDKYSINSRDNSQLDITLEGGQNILNIKALQFKKLTELQNDFGFDVVIDEDLGLGIVDPELSEEDLIMNLSVNSSEENGSNKVNMNIEGDIDVLDLYSGQGQNTFKIKGDLIGDDQNDPDDTRSADFNISGSTNLKIKASDDFFGTLGGVEEDDFAEGIAEVAISSKEDLGLVIDTTEITNSSLSAELKLNAKNIFVSYIEDNDNDSIHIDFKAKNLAQSKIEYNLTEVLSKTQDVNYNKNMLNNDLEGRFQLLKVTETLLEESNYYLFFNNDLKQLSGYAGCNRFSGTYKVTENNKINFGRLMATKMYCKDKMEIENGTIKAISLVSYYTITNDILTLYDENNTLLIKAIRKE